jgi:hypothetical protein
MSDVASLGTALATFSRGHVVSMKPGANTGSRRRLIGPHLASRASAGAADELGSFHPARTYISLPPVAMLLQMPVLDARHDVCGVALYRDF